MPSHDFGYQPGYVPSGVDTGYPTEAPGPVDDLLDPARTEIGEHYLRVMNEDPDAIARAAGGWAKFSDALDSLAVSLRRKGEDLQAAWTSEAGEAFLLKIGSTTYSLDEWRQVAATNGTALSVLAETVGPLRTRMDRLYKEYSAKAAQLQAQDDDNSSAIELVRDVTDTIGYHRSGNLKVQYNERSRAEVMEPLAAAYSTAFSALGGGTRFAGPKDAVVTDPSRIGQLLRNGMGAPGGPGSAPTRPGGAQPNPADQPQLHGQTPPGAVGEQPPQPGRQPDGAFIQDAPTPVGQPGPVPVIAPVLALPVRPAPEPPGDVRPGDVAGDPPVSPGGLPVSLGSAVLAATALHGTPPAAPTGSPGNLAGNRAAPAAPTPPKTGTAASPGLRSLLGRSAPTAPTGMPHGTGGGPAPQLPGRAAPGGGAAPARPGGGTTFPGVPDRPGAGSPALPGRTGGSRGGGAAPRTAGGTPPGGELRSPGLPGSLRGSRGRPPAAPRVPGAGVSGSAAAEPAPGLGGRGSRSRRRAPETTESTRSALRRGLDGRPAAPRPAEGRGSIGRPGVPRATGPTPARPLRRREAEEAVLVERVGDEELFDVDDGPAGVIGRPEEREQGKRPGPALGRR
jgi:hypothetical protein